MRTEVKRPTLFFWKSVMLVLFVGCMSAIVPAVARAQTTYTYVGSPFTDGSFGCDGSSISKCGDVSGSFTVASPLAANFDGGVTPISFSFSGFGAASATINQSDATTAGFQISTDSTGAIADWDIALNVEHSDSCGSDCTERTEVYVDTSSDTKGATDRVETDDFDSKDITGLEFYDQNTGNPGTWTESGDTLTPTPEPGSFVLFGSSMLTLFGMIRRRKASGLVS